MRRTLARRIAALAVFVHVATVLLWRPCACDATPTSPSCCTSAQGASGSPGACPAMPSGTTCPDDGGCSLGSACLSHPVIEAARAALPAPDTALVALAPPLHVPSAAQAPAPLRLLSPPESPPLALLLARTSVLRI